MPSQKASGTQAATAGGTEDTLATITDAGNYVLYVNMENMVLGDILELRVKLKVISTSTTDEIFLGTYAHVQEQLVAASIPVSVVEEAVFTLTQTAGTGRNFEFSIVDMS